MSHFQTPLLPTTYIPKDTITLLNGVEMPLLGLVRHTYIPVLPAHIYKHTYIHTYIQGTWQLDGHVCVDAVSAAIELGYRAIDTAEVMPKTIIQ